MDVCIYDSMQSNSISQSLKKMICSFVKASDDFVNFQIVNVAGQTNTNDCGVFALAYATELALGAADPAMCDWVVEKMRQHLLLCLERGRMEPFPMLLKKRHIPLGCRVRRCVREKVHCLCRLPNDPEKAMIQCVNCKQSYHGDCIGIALDTVNIKLWTCTTCKEYWQEFKAGVLSPHCTITNKP